MKLQLASFFGLLALGEASVLQRRERACDRDLCFRAIISTVWPGAADCASFFPNLATPTTTYTVTPSAVTITVTATATESFTQTNSQTVTNTVQDTLTITLPTTVNGGTVQITETTTIPLVTDSATLPEISLEKRDAASVTWSDVISSGTAPGYAAPCSGWIRYSSACSCILKSVVTVDTPSSTVTVAQVTVSVTETISPTLATVDVTVTSASITEFETATVTETTVATATWVALYIAGQDADLNKPNQYLKLDSPVPGYPGLTPLTWTTNNGEATKFNLNLSTGHLKVESTQEFVCAQLTRDAVFAYVMSQAAVELYLPQRLEFSVESNSLKLETGDFTKLGWTANAGENLIIAKAAANLGRFKSKEVLLKVTSE